jgi:hypothetical protein
MNGLGAPVEAAQSAVNQAVTSSTFHEAPGPKVVAASTAAQKPLYVFDSSGNNTGQPTQLYQKYQNNLRCLPRRRPTWR